MKDSTISRVMREMGRKGGQVGGSKGGKIRMASMTPAERSELARAAIKARWKKAKAAAAKKTRPTKRGAGA
jgi:hypothetical protein